MLIADFGLRISDWRLRIDRIGFRPSIHNQRYFNPQSEVLQSAIRNRQSAIANPK